MKLTQLTLSIAMILSLVTSALGQDKVNFNSIKITDNIYMLKGGGANVGVSVGEDGMLIVDDKYETITDELKMALKELGNDTPKFILNTHLHGDHVGGNEELGKESNIIAHKNVRKRLKIQTREWSTELTPMPEAGLPVITFEEELSIHFNGEEVKAIHLPKGHTDGDAIVYFTRSNVLHTGDHYFEGRFPLVDLDNGGNVAQFIENVAAIIDMMPDDVIIIPGHGDLSNKEEIKEFHSMLIETVTFIWNKMSRHISLSDIQEKGLHKKYKKWSWSFIPEKRWIKIVYDSYIDLVGS